MKTEAAAVFIRCSAIILCVANFAAVQVTASERAETIYEDDFRANATSGFLSLIAEGNLEEALAGSTQRQHAGVSPSMTSGDTLRRMKSCTE